MLGQRKTIVGKYDQRKIPYCEVRYKDRRKHRRYFILFKRGIMYMKSIKDNNIKEKYNIKNIINSRNIKLSKMLKHNILTIATLFFLLLFIPINAFAINVNLLWSDGSTNEDGFIVERATSTTGPWVEIGRSLVNINTFIDKAGSLGSCYRVWAYNVGGRSINSTNIKCVPNLPGDPGNLDFTLSMSFKGRINPDGTVTGKAEDVTIVASLNSKRIPKRSRNIEGTIEIAGK